MTKSEGSEGLGAGVAVYHNFMNGSADLIFN